MKRGTEAFHHHDHQHLQQRDEERMTVLDKPSVFSKTRKSPDLYLNEKIEGAHSADGLHVSEAEYWKTYYHDPDFRYEWNNGVLEEKPMADYLSFAMYRWFFVLLNEFLKAHPIATIIGLDIGFRLALPQKITIRRPDLAIILHTNPAAIADDECTYRGIFDLCIESGVTQSLWFPVKRGYVVL